MKPLSHTAMAEATRLTAAGRLDEAMELLRGAVSGAPSPAPMSEAQAEPRPAATRAPEVIDMVPPSAATGGCWTSPLHAAAGAGAGKESARMFPGLHPQTPPAGGRAAVLPTGALFEQLAFANEAGRRDYKLYIPSASPASPRRW